MTDLLKRILTFPIPLWHILLLVWIAIVAAKVLS